MWYSEPPKEIKLWLLKENMTTYFINLSGESGDKCTSYEADIRIENLQDMSTVYECSVDQRLPKAKLGKIKENYSTKMTLSYFKDEDLPYTINFEITK
jgi:hypothetical protein